MAKKRLEGYTFYSRKVHSEFADDLWKAIVETPRGWVYSCSWRKDEAPTEAEIKEAWLTSRRAFTPGD